MPGLEILIRGLVELHKLPLAHRAMAELSDVASKTGTLAVRAATEMALGCIALAEKQHHGARRHFEDGLDAYMRAGAPFEQGRARILLAQALKELGEQEAAIAQVQSAMSLFTFLNAELENTRARNLLQLLTADGVLHETTNKLRGGTLSRREVEVIRLVATGLNNHIIAERLCISEHTVHRHLANILMKLDVNSRAAAVAHAAQLGLLIPNS